MVICPGSRNFPLIYAMQSAGNRLSMHSFADERSAAFVALGMAQSLNEPVAVCCTSGTAALNLYPAVAEAFYAEIPLLVLTADRPPESIDNWEGQSIRQNNLFYAHCNHNFQTPMEFENTSVFRELAQKAWKAASLQTQVHVNIPIREPFYTSIQFHFSESIEHEKLEKKYENVPDNFVQDISSSKKILWLNGADTIQTILDYPKNLVVFSDVISNKNETISHWENILLANKNLAEQLQPDLIITTGKYFVSKALRQFLTDTNSLKHWHLSDKKIVPTPFKTTPWLVNISAETALQQIKEHHSDKNFIEDWKLLEKKFEFFFTNIVSEDFTELSVITRLYRMLPTHSVLQMANSMSVRYVSMLKRRNDIIHLSNRGTSGIDGCTSTAVGYAKTTTELVFLITGDVAFFYDVNAFWTDSFPQNLKIVLMNNFGGGIFEMIEGPSEFKESVAFQTTNHHRTAQNICSDFGVDYFCCSNFDEFDGAWQHFCQSEKASVLEIMTNRVENVSFYNKLKKGHNE